MTDTLGLRDRSASVGAMGSHTSTSYARSLEFSKTVTSLTYSSFKNNYILSQNKALQVTFESHFNNALTTFPKHVILYL